MLAIGSQAQDTYESARLVNEDLNGTARYVGMGGAMEALGADISTISSNPAGIGLFRKSSVSGSFGLVSQDGVETFDKTNKTNMSFDQAGFVYSMRTSKKSFLNFAFNYHKSKNFDQILSAAGSLSGASQNKLSYVKGAVGVFDAVMRGHGNSDGSFTQTNDGAWIGVNEGYNGSLYESGAYSQLDYLYYNTYLMNGETAYYDNANAFSMNRGNYGYIGEYDFNISGNANDRFYWGVTFGLHDVRYHNTSVYSEQLDAGGVTAVSDRRDITGTGFDVKAGVIFRPVESSPFRIGLYVQSPTWYDLNTSNVTTLAYAAPSGSTSESSAKGSISESYDFKLYTPWKFGVSLGHTVGNYLALGATYEYSDYGTNDIRVNDGGYYDDWGSYYETSSSDKAMNDHTKSTLRGVSTLKLGVEFKPVSDWSVRLGYNYVSPVYEKDGFRDGSISSYGTYYSSTTDYTNWKATNRFTVGAGYAYRGWTFDLAYQYSQTNGDFYPFMSYSEGSDLDCIADGTKVSNKRNQLIFTLGYRF